MELPERLPSEWFLKQFRRRLEREEFADAKDALDRLKGAGCEPSILLACLEIYSYHIAAKREQQPSLSYIPEFLENNASVVAEAEKLAMDLEENANRIEQLNLRREIRRELTLWEERRPDLTNDMRSQASWLKRTAEKIRSPFDLRDQPGQVMNYVIGYTRKLTGKDPAPELAILVRVAYAVAGIKEGVDEDSLGRTVRRARRRLKKTK